MMQQKHNKRHKRKRKKRELPPLTQRFCVVCNKDTTFKYEPNLGHSRCVNCGSMNKIKL
jgi:transcription elongation factor Elf1